MDQHLAECEECRRRLEELRRFDQMVRDNSGLGESDFWEKSARKVEQRIGLEPDNVTEIARRPATSVRGLWWKLTAAAASIVLVAYIGLKESDVAEQPVAPTMPAPSIKPAPIQKQAESEPLGRQESDEVEDLRDQSGVAGEAEDSDLGSDRLETAAGAAAPSEQKSEEGLQATPKPPIGAPAVVPEMKGRTDARSALGEPSSEESPAVAIPTPPPPPPAAPENYRSRVAPGHVEQPAAELEKEAVADPDVAEASELAEWRRVRDSLTAALAKDKSRVKKEPAKAAYELVKPNSLAQGEAWSDEFVPPIATAPSARLLEAWYHICLLSGDSVEISQGRASLDSVAADTTSQESTLAREYLNKLDNR